MKTQFAESLTCDFEENTWTFEMIGEFTIGSGKFAIVPQNKYQSLIKNQTPLDYRATRILVVNKIIEEISKRGRNFFQNKKDNDVAFIFEKKGRLYMHSEYHKIDMPLSTKHGYPPLNWHHGGTIWSLTKDFKEFILEGGKTNHNNGYGGLHCPHWGYPIADMEAIQTLAKQLGYL